jgi:enamine deaminase RidA (YjgF/YER057c/UK114 family)
MTFDDVLRTWIYLGDITATEKQTTRYFELNRARTHFYQGRQFAERLLPRPWNRSAYPASTGIGTRGRDIVLGGIAVDAKSGDVVVVPMENPDQTAACDYAHRYGNDSPKFSRAMALFSGDSATIFISGTASITASDTRHAENCRLQTEQTLENIEKLVSRENFRRHGFDGAGATLENMALARVYLKRAEDYALVRELCVNRLKNAPVLYIVGDICRPELLVEIEAVAFCRR